MRFSYLAACAVVSLITLSAVAGAQQSNQGTATAGATSAATEAEALKDTVALPAWPKASVELSANSQPVATSFALGAVEGIDPNLLTGVTADGFARKVKVENQAIGQVLITTVSKGEKQAAVGEEGLTAQFDASEVSSLFPERNLTVEGSKSALVAALNALNEKDDKEKEKAADANEALVPNSTSGGSSNDLASGYTSPTLGAATTEEDPVVTYRTTTDDCKVRIEKDAVYVQDRTETITDGVVTDSGNCSDNGATFAISKSYLTCGDKFDADLTKAWAQYTRYYTDSNGETHTVSECEYDEGEFFAITEDESQCTVSLDWDLHVAVPQSALVYTNRNNKKVEARGCQDSTLTAAVNMAESTANCTIRNDYTPPGKSYQQSMWTYVLGGVTYAASSCIDNGTVYDHETIYQDSSGDYICKVLTDVSGGTATLQSQIAITVQGQRQYLTECTPDTATKQVVATTDGCTDPSKWDHDLSAGVSYGQERFYFAKADGSRYYVTACQTSKVSYDQESEITSYDPHDDKLFAYPLVTVTIDVNGSPYTIAKNVLLDGAVQMPYIQADPAYMDRQSGAATYEGCNAFYTTTRYEQWERPDGTIYEKAIGEGDPVGPTDICSTTTETAEYDTVSYSNKTPQGFTSYVSASHIYISRTKKTNPVTEEVFVGAKVVTGTRPYTTVSGGGEPPYPMPSNPWAKTHTSCAGSDGSETCRFYVTPKADGCGGTPIYGPISTAQYTGGTFTCNWTNNSHDWP